MEEQKGYYVGIAGTSVVIALWAVWDVYEWMKGLQMEGSKVVD